MSSGSSLRAYSPLPGPLQDIIDFYDKSCKGAWKPAWICLGIWLTLMSVAIILFAVSTSSITHATETTTGDASEDHTTISTSGASVYAAVIIFVISMSFMTAFFIYVVRGNPCKAKKAFANEIMTDELTKQGYLANPERMKTDDSRQWQVMADQIQRKVDERMSDRLMKRIAIAAIVSTTLSR